MRAVNLLPRDEPKRSFEAGRGVVFGAAGGAALVTAGLTALMLGAGGSVTENRARVDALNAELAAIPDASKAAESAAENAAISSELSKRTTALSTVLTGRIAWDGVLRQISQVLPEDVWLTTLTSTMPDPAAAPAPGASTTPGITLSGSTYTQSGVARLLSRLSVAPALANVRLQTSTADTDAKKIVRFTILADVKTVGGAS